jgi:hypothetical protein
MAEKKKSIIEEALLDANRIQEALNSNTKEILRSVAREEIDGLVKESLREDDYEEEDVDDTEELDLDDAGDAGEELPVGDEESGEEELGLDAVSNDYDEAGMDDTEGSEMNYGGEEESGEDYEMDMTSASDEDVISVYKKLSGDDEIEVVSDNEVHIKDPVSGSEYHVKLGGEEEEVAGIDALGLGAEMGVEDEYEEEAETEVPYEEGLGESEIVEYEIALEGEEEVSEQEEITEETAIGKTANGKPRTATSDVHMGNEASAPNTGDIEGQTAPKDTDTSGDNLQGGFDDDGENGSGDNHADHIMEDEAIDENEETVTETEEVTEGDEVTETEVVEEEVIDEEVVEEEDTVEETKYVGGKVKKVATAHTNKKLEESVTKYNTLLAETKQIKQENLEFRGALKKFRTMLGETVVFNTNLTNVTRLFTEHSTTKEEKEAIIARFDNEVSTIKESKRLYKAIATELGNKQPISESVENKISKEAGSSASKQLNENTAYVDASTQRIMDLIQRVETPRD